MKASSQEASVVGSPPPTKVARTQAEEAVEAVEVAPIAKEGNRNNEGRQVSPSLEPTVSQPPKHRVYTNHLPFHFKPHMKLNRS